MTTSRFRGVTWLPPKPATPVPSRSDPRTLPPLTHVPLPGRGPEHIAVDDAGRLVTGLADGRIVRVDPAGGDWELFADTGGRPLGLEFDGEGRLVVGDAERGLLRVTVPTGTEAGSVEVLCAEIDGEPLIFCSCPAIAHDGTIYFTQSSRRYPLDHYKGDLLEHSGTGRVLRYRDGRAEVIADGLQFANGIVLAEDESNLVVAETAAYRVTRYDLADGEITGSRALVDALPGFPDNLTAGPDGLVWIGMASPRDGLLDFLLPKAPWIRALVWSLPDRLTPEPKNLAWALAVDRDGRTVHDLRGWNAGYRMVTVARQHGRKLYLGALREPSIAAMDLP